MSKEILYTSAKNYKDDIIHVNDALKGNAYYCAGCNGRMILHKSGRKGKGSKRPHFVHHNVTGNCTPEGILHLSFKKMLIDLLERKMSEGVPQIVSWTCDSCGKEYKSANLLIKTSSVNEEHYLGECRPDIALLDNMKRTMAAIEVVVTHAPEESTLDYYRRHGITLIQINLESEEDLNRIEEKISRPDLVNLCLNTSCNNFKNHLSNRKFSLNEGTCRQCKRPVATCALELNNVFGTIQSNNFTDTEKELAQAHGVVFGKRKDARSGETYDLVVCEPCEKRRTIQIDIGKSGRRNWRL